MLHVHAQREGVGVMSPGFDVVQELKKMSTSGKASDSVGEAS